MVELLLYSSNKFKFQQNGSILKSSIKFFVKSELKFSRSLIGKYSPQLYFLFVCFFICSLNLKYIHKLPHTIPKQSGVCLGLIDKNQFLHFFWFNKLIAFYDST